jgi:hypothetical protein
MMQNKVLGIFEQVDFPEFGIKNISAKMDSGAYTGALHCTDVFESKTDKGTELHFAPFDFPDVKIITSDYTVKKVKSSSGVQETRYFIKTTIKLKGKTYPILLSLADRSTMRWSVLIGRKFLGKNEFLVNVNQSTVPMRDY